MGKPSTAQEENATVALSPVARLVAVVVRGLVQLLQVGWV